MALATIEEAIQDLRDGKFVILVDDEDRENEGDLVMAAEKVTPESINFMATHGRGLICMPVTSQRLEELRLPMMVQDNTSRYTTAFTVTVDAIHGATTGISAFDRAATVQAVLDPATKPEDLARPGGRRPGQGRPDGGVGGPDQTGRPVSGVRPLRDDEGGRHDGPYAGPGGVL